MLGKIAIVTGASGGMGAAEARIFAAEGASVVVVDVQDDLGEKIVGEISDSSGSARYLHLDVTQEDQWIKVIDDVVGDYGQLDVLVNNAGIGGGAPEITNVTVDQWDRILAVNATGVFLGTKHGAKAMKLSGGGSIINISSVYALIGCPLGAPYPVSKGAVRSYTKAAAVQLAANGIRVNSVHPGFIDTPQTSWMLTDPDTVRNLNERTPLGWIAQPEDIAWGVLYLASDESAYMTGTEFVIDGGITAQ